ncbi:MAG: hypothetical protein HYZ28_09485 [Myxococcales bacterium]|nr:hypothetical protein [Myxococcales bacterium]
MARDPWRGPFSLYYWGQDRFGAWPYLAMGAWTKLTGWSWTPERLSAVQAVFALAGALAFALLRSRRAAWIASTACIASMLLHPAVRAHLFSSSQPYAWQWPLLILAWAFIRCVLAPGSRAMALGAALSCSALAVWMSPLSALYLLLITGGELLRRMVLSGNRLRALRRARWGRALALIASAVLLELALRWIHHRSTLAESGVVYRTLIRGDRGHLVENARALFAVWVDGAWWPLAALALLAPLGWLLAARRRRSPAAALESWGLASTALATALVGFLLCVVLSHVRLNGYAERYLCTTHLLFDISGALTLHALALQAVPSRRWRWAATASLVAVFAGWIAARLPSAERNPRYDRMRALAQAVTARGSPRIVLGDYWSIYVLAAQASPGTLLPLSAEVERDTRTPFHRHAIPQAREVLVSHGQTQFLSTDGAPVQQFEQYGRRFHLEMARAWQVEEVTVSVYRVEP